MNKLEEKSALTKALDILIPKENKVDDLISDIWAAGRNCDREKYDSATDELTGIFANLITALEEKETADRELRKWLWLNHGHIVLYGDDGEMQCQECFPVYDYKRFSFKELITQVIKVQNEQAELIVAKLRAQLVDTITDKEEAERKYTNCVDSIRQAEARVKELERCVLVQPDQVAYINKRYEIPMANLLTQLAAAREGLEYAIGKQEDAFKIMERENIVIDNHDDKMQKFAFTLYTMLAEIRVQCDQTLKQMGE